MRGYYIRTPFTTKIEYKFVACPGHLETLSPHILDTKLHHMIHIPNETATKLHAPRSIYNNVGASGVNVCTSPCTQNTRKA